MSASFRGFSAGDLAVLAGYFIVAAGVVWAASRRTRSPEEFFLGGRRFGRLIQTFAAFGQATSVESITVMTTVVAVNGAAGIWAILASGLFLMPVFWMTSMWYRRLRVLTLADFFTERYGSPAMAAFYAVCQILFFVIAMAIALAAFGKTVTAIAEKPETSLTASEHAQLGLAREQQVLEQADYQSLDGTQRARLAELRRLGPPDSFSYFDTNWVIAGVAVVTLLYAAAGGLGAAFVTDLIQGSLILLLTVAMVPFAAAQLIHRYGTNGTGGVFPALHRAMPDSFFDVWGSPALPEFTWYWIAAFSLVTVFNTTTQANQLTTCGAARDDRAARHGFVFGLFLKRYAVLLWGFLAMLIVALDGAASRDPDLVWGHATRAVFAPVGLGLVGAMVAALLAALMASKSAMILTSAALMTQNLYRPLVPGRTEAHYVAVGRWFSVVSAAAAVALAIVFHDVFGLFKFMMTFNAILAAAFILGMVWRRANRVGAWASMGFMFVTTVVLPFGLPLIPGVREAAALGVTTRDVEVVRSYRASPADVAERARAQTAWDRAAAKATGPRPAVLRDGDRFEKVYLQPARSVFWTEGLDTTGRSPRGKGQLKVELVALHWLGWDLTRNSYAWNETLSLLFRLVPPLFILMIVSVLTRPENENRLRQFYGKMRTPAVASPDEDARAMALTRSDPRRFDHLKLFGPDSAWELRRWDRDDWRGVIGCILGALGVVGLLALMVNVGR